MGGQNSGEVASSVCVATMPALQQALLSKPFSQALQEWLRHADQEVSFAAPGGGCTLVMLYYAYGRIMLAHVGDSRIYRLHAGKLERLTRDHSQMEMMIQAGLITPADARTHPARHVITRFVGMGNDEVSCDATVAGPLTAESGDRYLLCSDGVTDMLEDEQLEAILCAPGDARDCACSIYNAALEAGGRDNTTCIVLDIHTDGPVTVPAPKSETTPLVNHRPPEANAPWQTAPQQPEAATPWGAPSVQNAKPSGSKKARWPWILLGCSAAVYLLSVIMVLL